MEREQPQGFVLVEAINIYAAVYDTNQLSVIRGSSLLLKQAIEAVVARFEGEGLKPLSTGASSGLFAVDHSKNPSSLAEAVASFLNRAPPFCYFTFAVEHCEASDLLKAKEILYAKLRFRQLRSPTQAPDASIPAEGQIACALEGVRPANKKTNIPRERDPVWLSASVYRRRKVGIEQRQGLYQQECEALKDRFKDLVFSERFEDIVAENRFSQLGNKLAVIYFDGNGFGKLQRKSLEKEKRLRRQIDAQRAFDAEIKHQRCTFLENLLAAMTADKTESSADLSQPLPAFFNSILKQSDQRILRLETLLWGGDEMLFVVPAWIGFDLLNLFYNLARHWEIDGKALSHAGGIVFCNAKTPISRMRALAQQLADGVKERRGGRDADWFDYAVLESIDYPAEQSLDEFWGKRFGSLAAERRPLPPFEAWPEMRKLLHGLLRQGRLARSQVYRIVREALREDPQALFDGRDAPPLVERPKDSLAPAIKRLPLSRLCELEQRLFEVDDNAGPLKQDLRRVAEMLGIDHWNPRSRVWLWIHLAELWDYLAPALKGQGEGHD